MKVTMERMYFLRHDLQTTSLAILEMNQNLFRTASARRKAFIEDLEEQKFERNKQETETCSNNPTIEKKSRVSINSETFVVEGPSLTKNSFSPARTTSLNRPFQEAAVSKAALPIIATPTNETSLEASSNTQMKTKFPKYDFKLTPGGKNLQLCSHPLSGVHVDDECYYSGYPLEPHFPLLGEELESTRKWWEYTQINPYMPPTPYFPDSSYHNPYKEAEGHLMSPSINAYALHYNYGSQYLPVPLYGYSGYYMRPEQKFQPKENYNVHNSITGANDDFDSGLPGPYIDPEMINYWGLYWNPEGAEHEKEEGGGEKREEEEEDEEDEFDSDLHPQYYPPAYRYQSFYNQRLSSLSTQTDDAESSSSDSNNISIKIPAAF